jgi:hypothetical protein
MVATVHFTVFYSPRPSKHIKIKMEETVILPDALYGCETWSLMIREEHRIKVFENGVLRRMFGPKREEVARGWRSLHDLEISSVLLGRSNQGGCDGKDM